MNSTREFNDIQQVVFLSGSNVNDTFVWHRIKINEFHNFICSDEYFIRNISDTSKQSNEISIRTWNTRVMNKGVPCQNYEFV